MKLLWLPLALIYGFVIRLRNWLFDKQILRSIPYNFPVILVGNLSTGGTGKTPCVEFLVSLLKKKSKVVVLSRGYKRKTRGFQLANQQSTWRDVGDEPLQIASKNPDITVAVDRDRNHGIRELLQASSPPDCIILDDGFQHRSVKPGLSILLTEYSNLYSDDFLLPFGNLREHRHNSKRADIIIVTKSPAVKSPVSDKILIKRLKPLKHQLVFFSYISYGNLTPVTEAGRRFLNEKTIHTILLLTGIANPSYLQQHLQQNCSKLATLNFPDHHHFTANDISRVTRTFEDEYSANKIIVITEKDLYRLKHEDSFEELEKFPVFYIPISIAFHENYRGLSFSQIIEEYVRSNTKNSLLDPGKITPFA